MLKSYNISLKTLIKFLILVSVIFFVIVVNQENSSFVIQKPTIHAFYNKTIKPPGVFLEPLGGIGNQLFEYACSYALAKENNWPLYVFRDKYNERSFSPKQREFALDQFSIPNFNYFDLTTNFSNVVHIREDFILEKKLPELVKNDSFVIFSGYCQSEMFWLNYTEEIKSFFRPPVDIGFSLPVTVKHFLSDIRETESVAVHVRRGDFLSADNGAYFVPLSYHRCAIRRMIKILKEQGKSKPVFYVFSDDSDYVKDKFSDFEEEYTFVYVSAFNTSSLQDFYLMIHCKHIILPNSTFGWWAAYLNTNPDKVIIASAFNPEFWRFNPRNLYGKMYYPASWIVIDTFSGEQ